MLTEAGQELRPELVEQN